MYEKVNPSHPDKVADRIAGSIVDLAYANQEDPKIAVEVLIGHSRCYIIIETSVMLDIEVIKGNVKRISQCDDIETFITQIPQDRHLAENQEDKFKCGDNGIFKGMPVTDEQQKLTDLVGKLYERTPYDGKYIMSKDDKYIVACQSMIDEASLKNVIWDSTCEPSYYDWDVDANPLGFWTGGLDVDSGATNRKLGSDMGDAVTGGGLHGKDLSKADVTLNIVAHLMAQKTGKPKELMCAIGQETIGSKTYAFYVNMAKKYISDIGGFEKFAEWGLIRPNKAYKEDEKVK